MNYNMIQRFLCAIIVIASSFIFGVTVFGQASQPPREHIVASDEKSLVDVLKNYPGVSWAEVYRVNRNNLRFAVNRDSRGFRIPLIKEGDKILIPMPKEVVADTGKKIQKPGQRNQTSGLGQDAKKRIATFNTPQNLAATMARMDAELTAEKQKVVQLENERKAVLTKASAQEALVSELQKTVEFQKNAMSRAAVAEASQRSLTNLGLVAAVLLLGALVFVMFSAIGKSRQLLAVQGDLTQMSIEKDSAVRQHQDSEVLLAASKALIKRLSGEKERLEGSVQNLQRENLQIKESAQRLLAQNQQLEDEKQRLSQELNDARTSTSFLPGLSASTNPNHTTLMQPPVPVPQAKVSIGNGVSTTPIRVPQTNQA